MKAEVEKRKKASRTFAADKIETYEAATDNAAGLLDSLYSLMPSRSKTTVKSLLRNGQIKVNNTVTSQYDFPISQGDKVLVNLTKKWPELRNPRLKIVFEDKDIIVVYKGYGLLSVATDKKREGTAYSILRDYVKGASPTNKIFIVHRLDQHTSGLMVFAKNAEAKERLQHNWNNMVLERKYLAVVEGCPEQKEGTVRSYLLENAQHEVYSSPEQVDGSQLAVTRWRALRSRGKYTLMEVSLDTGRKNQIRVHLKDMGHPIAGDKKYGAKTSPIHRLALHAATLRFVHPITEKDMNFSTPAPASFSKLV